MLVQDFDYELPQERIAVQAQEPRDAARLLHLDRNTGEVAHHGFRNLPEFLRAGDLLVVNDTRVQPWRLRGKRATGGLVEMLLLRLVGELAEGFVKPSKKLRVGTVLPMEGGAIEAELLAAMGGGRWSMRLHAPHGTVSSVLEQVGRAPLPPYIARDGQEDVAADRARYQTLFAREPGAVAAPTAGLHFTEAVLAALRAKGVATASVTLHVGEGTFAPLRSEVVEEHVMHEEAFVLPAATEQAIHATRHRGGRVVAVGTTSARVLETCAVQNRLVAAQAGSTRLFLYPGRALQVVDVLLTNFHLPKSTLLMLVSAFAGRELVLAAYREAVRLGYRFYSFGDAMLIT